MHTAGTAFMKDWIPNAAKKSVDWPCYYVILEATFKLGKNKTSFFLFILMDKMAGHKAHKVLVWN